MKTSNLFTLFIVSSLIFITFSCQKDEVNNSISAPKTYSFKTHLSEYNLYSGNMSDLSPTNGYEEFDLSSSLFVNYAHKQRLIKLPNGQKIKKINEELPFFPEGTQLIKTFYYYKDEMNPSFGKQIIETRFLVKSQNQWNVATYVWNENQTDATIKLNGDQTNISWKDKNSINKSINYRIPSEQECTDCHQLNQEVTPIGPKLNNMNIMVNRNGIIKNQLQHFQDLGMMENFDHASISVLPDYFDNQFSLEDRGRAYFELNCAHCHNPNGFCNQKPFDFRYLTPIENTLLKEKKGPIKTVISKQRMPLIGISTLDEEGYKLVQDFLNAI
ncbi:MAG: hypothetical protein ACPGSD_14075 [Flavobacteriales bacterium]